MNANATSRPAPARGPVCYADLARVLRVLKPYRGPRTGPPFYRAVHIRDGRLLVTDGVRLARMQEAAPLDLPDGDWDLYPFLDELAVGGAMPVGGGRRAEDGRLYLSLPHLRLVVPSAYRRSPQEDTLKLPAGPAPGDGEAVPLEVPRTVWEGLLAFAATPSPRFRDAQWRILEGIALEGVRGHLTLTASEGRRLLTWRAAPPAPAPLKLSTRTPRWGVLPALRWPGPATRMTAVRDGKGEGWLRLEGSGVVIEAPTLAGRYPDWQRILPSAQDRPPIIRWTPAQWGRMTAAWHALRQARPGDFGVSGRAVIRVADGKAPVVLGETDEPVLATAPPLFGADPCVHLAFDPACLDGIRYLDPRATTAVYYYGPQNPVIFRQRLTHGELRAVILPLRQLV